MAETIPNILVDSTAWVDVYSEANIPVGDPMELVNKGTTWCQLYEGDVAPSLDSDDGDLLSNYSNNYATATVLEGSLKIWALSTVEGRSLNLAVKAL